MIGSVASTVSMTAASLGLIDFIDSTASTTSTTLTTLSLSATSVFHGGGVGAGVPGGAPAGAIHTDTMEAITMATTVPVMDTATAVGLEWPSYSAGSPAPVITTGPSTESWDLRRVEQLGPTRATTGMQVEPVSSIEPMTLASVVVSYNLC